MSYHSVRKTDVDKGLFAFLSVFTGDAESAFRSAFPENAKGKTDEVIAVQANQLLNEESMKKARNKALLFMVEFSPIHIRETVSQSLKNMRDFCKSYTKANRIKQKYGQPYEEVIQDFTLEELSCIEMIITSKNDDNVLVIDDAKMCKPDPYYKIGKDLASDIFKLIAEAKSAGDTDVVTSVDGKELEQGDQKVVFMPSTGGKVHSSLLGDTSDIENDTNKLVGELEAIKQGRS